MLYPEGRDSRTGSGFDVEDDVRRKVKNEAQSFGLSKADGEGGGFVYPGAASHGIG